MMSYLGKSWRKKSQIVAIVLKPGVWAGGLFRKHPRGTALLLTLVIVTATGLGLILYSFGQWHAAQAAVKEGRWEDIKAPLEFCLWLWPRSVPVHLLAARAARLGGDLVEAESHLNQCLKISPGANEAVHLEFLLLRVQSGEVEELAPELMRLVHNQHPETSSILETLTLAHLINLRYGPALACIERWIEETPDKGLPFYWRGWALERVDNIDGAMLDYQQAVELTPDNCQFRLLLAEKLLENNRPKEALGHLEHLRKRHPDCVATLGRLGCCLFLLERETEAQALLEAAVEKKPEDPLVVTHLARLELQRGNPEKAEKRLNRLLKQFPNELVARFILVDCLRQQGRLEEAARVLRQHEVHQALLKRANGLLMEQRECLSQDPGQTAELGRILLQIGQERPGLFWLMRTLKKDPGNQEAHKALAEYYLTKGEINLAGDHRRFLKEVAKKGARP